MIVYKFNNKKVMSKLLIKYFEIKFNKIIIFKDCNKNSFEY
jgi:hypothetical protein